MSEKEQKEQLIKVLVEKYFADATLADMRLVYIAAREILT